MKGVIKRINARRGMVAVETDDAFSIFEILSGDVEVGDVVSWSGSSPLGCETIKNRTRGTDIEVSFENHDVPTGQLSRQLLE